MEIASDLVNAWTEPPLFPSGGLAITLECLVDLDESTALFVVSARDVTAGKLHALWSSAPVGFEDVDKVLRRASSELSELVRNHTGPFADPLR